jgi:galactose mutarotase-like enzyme
MHVDTLDDGGLETWVASDGRTRLDLIPSRGGLVSRWRVDGDEVLFMDRGTLLDQSKNVRGGIPQLFPWPGRSPVAGQPQHGFARMLKWTMVGTAAAESSARLECELRSSAQTREVFPHDFELRFAVSVTHERLALEWAVHNTGGAALPLHLGLHPYFRAPLATKAQARLRHHATRQWNNVTKAEQPAGELDFSGPEVDAHLLDHAPTTVTLERGDGREVVLTWTPQFHTLVAWTQPEREFICVEPWTAPAGALETQSGLIQVAPGAVERLAVEVRLRRH